MGCSQSTAKQATKPNTEKEKAAPPIPAVVEETLAQKAEDSLEATERCLCCGNDTSGCCTIPGICACLYNCATCQCCSCECSCDLCGCCAKPPPPPPVEGKKSQQTATGAKTGPKTGPKTGANTGAKPGAKTTLRAVAVRQ